MLLFACLLSLSTALLGTDTTYVLPTSGIACLKNMSSDFIIFLASDSNTGKFYSSVASTVKNAWSIGFEKAQVDLLFTPCVTCGNPETQIVEFYGNVTSNKLKPNCIWLNVIDGWYSDIPDRQGFFEKMIAQATKSKMTFGIFTSKKYWEGVFGDTYECPNARTTPLFYYNSDNNPSFSDFRRFGGWAKPTAKRYSPNNYVCNTKANYDYKE
ncbi:lysozyme, putative [Entamoeba invadens IP1]|uniref:Lysozyme, putative n=1 Tax=Entamoeba invadens IP1 TaxID=370355 RepID=L7FJZ0_ENTIV|nr:lysozyme, putative [Entamoeba invadens IP1]ELP84865.1 lysozyme, putative [Entamoeba invadens IP1]|eukprot:XP_004184211.1 lysozyme, putative [Entamoeba invadens IP1]